MHFLLKVGRFKASSTARAAFFIALHLFSNPGIGQQDSVRLTTVVVQATRAGREAPVPHTNISAEKIARTYHAQDVPFLLSSIPSLVENSDAGAGVGYTGLRIRGSDQTRVNVTLNGVPLNDAESQNVFWVNLPDLAASASEIQVQRGVGTSTNGAGAFGATINLDLSAVSPKPFVESNNTLGAFNTRKNSLRLGTGLIDGKWSLSARLSNIRSDGYIDRARVDLNAYHVSGAYLGEKQSWQFHILSGHEITYQAWYGVPAQYIDDPQRRTFNVAGTEKPGEPYDDEVDDYAQRHFLLHYKRQTGRYGLLQINGHYTRGGGYFEQYKAGQLLTDYGFPGLVLPDTTIQQTDLVRRLALDNDFYGLTFSWDWSPPVNPPFFQKHPLFRIGGAANRYLGRHFGEVIWAAASPIEKDAVFYDNDADKRDFNLFGQIQLYWKNNLHTFLDLQYRTIDYRFLGIDAFLNPVDQTAVLHFFNPKAGVHWALNEQWKVQSFFGIGHREPNRDDFTQSTPDDRPLPERLYDWETGISRTAANLWLSANLYYMFYRNQLVLDGRLNNVGAYIRTNIPESYRMGMELEYRWRPANRLDLEGNLSLSRNKIPEFAEYVDNWDTGGQEVIIHTNTDISFSPAVVSNTALTWLALQQDRGRLSFTLNGKYVSRQYLDNTSNRHTSLDPYFAADARLNVTLSTRSGQEIAVVASVNNLLNRRYSPNGWTYRYISEAFDERPFNPYARLEGGNVYNQTGFFPQALRYWMLGLNIRI